MRPLKPWEGTRRSVHLTEDEVVALFKRQRKVSVASFLFIMLSLGLPHLLPFVLKPATAELFFTHYLRPYMAVALIGSVVSVILIIRSHRCPRCRAIPSTNREGYTQSVLLFPRRCGKCGAPLLPHHPYGQEP